MKFLYFSSSWCGPCKMLAPIVKKLQHEGLQIEKVDVDEVPKLAQQYGIRNIPAIIKINETSEPIGTIIGFQSENMIREFYNG